MYIVNMIKFIKLLLRAAMVASIMWAPAAGFYYGVIWDSVWPLIATIVYSAAGFAYMAELSQKEERRQINRWLNRR